MKTARVDDDLKSGHITPADGNLFADLGFSPEQAEALLKQADARIAKSQKLKKEAAMAIAQWIQSEKLTQFAASEILDVSRPRVSDLVNEKLGRFSLDMLVAMLLRTGKTVELVVHSKHPLAIRRNSPGNEPLPIIDGIAGVVQW